MIGDVLPRAYRECVQPIASTRHTIILLSILAIVSLATWRANSTRGSSEPQNRIPLYAGAIAAEAGLGYMVVKGLRGITPRQIIGPARIIDIPIAAVFWVGARLLLTFVRQLLGGADAHVSGLTPVTLTEKIAWVAVSIAAGVVEELVYRGYLQKQFAAWTRSATAAIVLQAAVFGLSHGYQGPKSIVAIVCYGVLFGMLAAWRRSLIPGILAHACTDIAGGLGL